MKYHPPLLTLATLAAALASFALLVGSPSRSADLHTAADVHVDALQLVATEVRS